MPSTQLTPTIGSTPTPAKNIRLGDTLASQLGALLSEALTDASSLKVRTFTSIHAESELARSEDPLVENTRLRAFTRIAMDGDTEQCIPLKASGEPDELLWALHTEAVTQARRDRAASVDAVISLLKELAGR